MDEFGYLSVLLSIIVGLAITQLLKGYRGIALARARVRIYWPTLVWMGLLFLVFVQSWWAMFGLRSHHDWTFIQFFVVITHTVLLYMLAALVLPDLFGEEAIDLRAHYFAHARLFYCIAIAATVASLLKDVALDGRLPDRGNVGAHVAWLAISAMAVATRREWVHKLAAAGAVVGFVLYVVLLFTRLQR